jgi:D-glycero-D-manno-heptose 1,7-bisphosphate phosphatase
MLQTGIFIDRDGTINNEVDFLLTPDQLNLIPRSANAICELNKLSLKIFILTNQSGVARGLLTENELHVVHDRLLQMLENQNAHIDKIYYCPHHPEGSVEKYRKECECRKPKPGMLLSAAKEYKIDLSASYIIGDKMIDIQAGNNCGAGTVLVLTGYGKSELEVCRKNNIRIDHIAENLYDAVQFIKSRLDIHISQSTLR